MVRTSRCGRDNQGSNPSVGISGSYCLARCCGSLPLLLLQKCLCMGTWTWQCVRAAKEMDSKSIGLCPRGFESPRWLKVQWFNPLRLFLWNARYLPALQDKHQSDKLTWVGCVEKPMVASYPKIVGSSPTVAPHCTAHLGGSWSPMIRPAAQVEAWSSNFWFPSTGYSSVGRASDCRLCRHQMVWFDSGWPDFARRRWATHPSHHVHDLCSLIARELSGHVRSHATEGLACFTWLKTQKKSMNLLQSVGYVAQWQSGGLQISRSLVQTRACPFAKKQRDYSF